MTVKFKVPIIVTVDEFVQFTGILTSEVSVIVAVDDPDPCYYISCEKWMKPGDIEWRTTISDMIRAHFYEYALIKKKKQQKKQDQLAGIGIPQQGAQEVQFQPVEPNDWHVEHDFKKAKPVPQKQKSPLTLLAVGSDVEMFLRDPLGKPVPCIGLVGGTKEKPIPIEGLGDGFAIQEDNVMLEYNIPPAKTRADFVYNIRRVQEEITKKVKALGYIPAVESSMRFELAQLEHPQAKVFGCDPDLNVWARAENAKPELTDDIRNLRTAGGHVHVSFLVNGQAPTWPEHMAEIETIVMGLDAYIGVPSIFLDNDTERRKLYGRAGAFRIKPYGVEWRTSSNWWTKNPIYTEFVFDGVKKVFTFIENVGLKETGDLFRNYQKSIEEAINNSDKTKANYLMRNVGIELPVVE